MKPVILHLSNDYPDPLVPQKTRAVINLVEGTPQYRHVVYSLNRVTAWNGISCMPFGEDRLAVAYGALPKGLFWEKRLVAVAQWIAADMRARAIKPDLIEAHKFTVEGVIGLYLAREFSCPLVCDIQGGTDIKILKFKTSMRETYREIGQISAAVFPYAPWVMEEFQAQIGLDPAKCHNLPVIAGLDHLQPSPAGDGSHLVSVFHLDTWERKNFLGMVAAMKILIQSRPSARLDIYGRGSPQTLLKLNGFIRKVGIEKAVILKGSIENGRIQDVLQRHAALILPSKIETYGLVYAEGLFSGLPVLFNKDQAISGYFKTQDIGYGCNPSDVQDIARGMDYLLGNERALKDNITLMQKKGALDILRRPAILKTYSSVMDRVLAGRK